MRYSILLLLLFTVSSLHAAVMQRGRIRFEESAALSQTGATIIFPVRVEQKSGDHLVIEGEDVTHYAPMKFDSRLAYSPDYSNGAAMINARELCYEFTISDPGEYQVWIHAFFPRQANYNHSEKMDDNGLIRVSDSMNPVKAAKTSKAGATAMFVRDNFLPPNVWQWTPNLTYKLSKGKHRWLWPSPSAWCGGCMLDKIVLIKKGSNIKPEKAGVQNRVLKRSMQGVLISRRIKIQRIAAWMFDYAAAPGDGSIAVEYSYDEKNFKPLKSGFRYTTAGVKGEYLWIRIRMKNAAYGKRSPIIYHYTFKFEKKAKRG